MVPNEKGGMTLEVGKFLVGVGVIGGVVLALGAAIVRKVPLEPEDGPPRRVPTFNSESNGVAPRQQQQRATIPSTATVTTEGSPLLESAVLPSDVTTTDDDEIEEEPEPPQLRIVKTCLHTDTLLWLYAKLALSGAGAMFIGNVGSVVLAMAGDALPDDPDLQKRQSAVVATISIGSCLGRILFGFLYDVARRSFGARRVTLFLFLAMAMCGCQLWLVAMLRTGSADILPLLGTVMGTFYGGIAMSAPVVNAELFGAQFSAENYGAVMLGVRFCVVLCGFLGVRWAVANLLATSSFRLHIPTGRHGKLRIQHPLWPRLGRAPTQRPHDIRRDAFDCVPR